MLEIVFNVVIYLHPLWQNPTKELILIESPLLFYWFHYSCHGAAAGPSSPTAIQYMLIYRNGGKSTNSVERRSRKVNRPRCAGAWAKGSVGALNLSGSKGGGVNHGTRAPVRTRDNDEGVDPSHVDPLQD